MKKITLVNIIFIIIIIIISTNVQGQSKVIFEDKFNNNKNKWSEGLIFNHSGKVQNGEYLMTISGKKSSKPFISAIDVKNFDLNKDFSIECYATCHEGENIGGFGLVYDFKDYENYQEFIITQNGYFGNYKVSNGVQKKLNNKPLRSTEHFKPRSLNTLIIKKRDGTVEYFLNNSLINKFLIPELKFKGVGFIVYGKENISFDNLIIKQGNISKDNNELPLTYFDIDEQKVKELPKVLSNDEVTKENRGLLDAEKASHLTKNMKGRYNYALLIGVQDYMDGAINDLDHPIQDARDIKKILTSNYTFDDDKTILLENPTHASLIETFDKLAKTVGPLDNLLIFYAGHGVWDEQLKKGYWLPSNARKDYRAEWFSNSDLRDYIGGINSKHTLLIADACFSGGIFKTRDAFSSHASTAVLELYKLPSRQAITSGAMKSVPDKSVFLQFLLKRLSENTEPFLSAEQLFTSFKTAVINNSPNGQVPQFGEIKETGDEGGDFIFIKK